MNYFSHFFVDHIPGNHEYNTGLLLPDVTRNWIKTFKNHNSGSVSGEQFYRGCLTHYAADKQFHSSPFFKELFREAGIIINNSAFSSGLNRKWFLAHILLELMIDRILIGRFPELLDAFYFSLSHIKDGDLSVYLREQGMNEADTDYFFENFDHFRKVRYIYYYADNNKFVYSLNRIMMKAGVGELSEPDQAVLLNASLELEELLNKDVLMLIRKLKEINQ